MQYRFAVIYETPSNINTMRKAYFDMVSMVVTVLWTICPCFVFISTILSLLTFVHNRTFAKAMSLKNPIKIGRLNSTN